MSSELQIDIHQWGKANAQKKIYLKWTVYPVDDTQGQGFAVESIQDLNFRSGIKCLVGLLNWSKVFS